MKEMLYIFEFETQFTLQETVLWALFSAKIICASLSAKEREDHEGVFSEASCSSMSVASGWFRLRQLTD